MSSRRKIASLGAPARERFRRRQFVAPHRRRRLIFRLAKPFLAAVAIVGLPTVLVGWILLSDQFLVREIGVTSGDRVSPRWAGEQLSALEGRHLLTVDLDEVRQVLAEHPWVEGVLVHRRPPGRLQVNILEREPAGLLVNGEALVFVDATGRVIGDYEPGADPGDLVLLSAPQDRPELVASGLALIEQWRRLELPWAEGLSEVLVLTASDFKVITAALPCPLFVSSINLAEGLTALARYAPQIEDKLARWSRVGAIDLRFRGRIVFQPAASTPHNFEGETNA